MAANFLRAFELCDAEWMWMIADDDALSPDAVSSVLCETRAMSGRPSVAFIKFNRGTENVDCERDTIGVDGLISRLGESPKLFNSFIFLTNGAYRFPHFREQLECGYVSLHTYVPHLMMLLDYAYKCRDEDVIYLSQRQVASYVKPVMGYSYGRVAGLGVGALKNLTYNLTRGQYRSLDRAFAAHNDYKVAIDLYYDARSNGSAVVARRLVGDYYYLVRRGRGVVHRVLFKCFSLLLCVPVLFEGVVSVVGLMSATYARHIDEIRRRYASRAAG